ncbi:protein of unknown function (plasmid) [Rhodovastum atsumiense]|nr:protein of unknown function [Rhodovastum atsumiense]
MAFVSFRRRRLPENPERDGGAPFPCPSEDGHLLRARRGATCGGDFEAASIRVSLAGHLRQTAARQGHGPRWRTVTNRTTGVAAVRESATLS